MKKKLYLIRYNVFNFKGPMSLEGVKRYSKSAQSSAEDEISGNCGKWVQLGDFGRLRRYYPEVSKVVAKDNGDWGVSIASVEPIQGGFAKSLLSVRSLTVVFLLCIGGFLSLSFFNNGFSINGVFLSSKKPNPKTAHQLVLSNDMPRLSAFLKKNLVYIVKEVNKNPKLLNTWLPYLRAHAFSQDGEMKNIPLKVLYGSHLVPGVADCRFLAWVQVWRRQYVNIEQFVQAQSVVDSEAEKLLAWDPHWVARRKYPGWMKPTSLYHGCFTMAVKAMHKVLPKEQALSNAISARLNYMREVMNGRKVSFMFDSVSELNLLDLFSCYEQAQSPKHLEICGSFEVENARINEILSFKRLLAEARIAQDDAEKLRAILSKISEYAPLYKFNYAAEISYWQQRGVGSSHADAARMIQSKYPVVNFK